MLETPRGLFNPRREKKRNWWGGVNRGNNGSFLSQAGREPGQELAPLPARGCPSSSPCSGCLGVPLGSSQLHFGDFSPCRTPRAVWLDFSWYKTVRSLQTPVEGGGVWREGPCLAFAGQGDTHTGFWSHTGDALLLVRKGGSRSVLPCPVALQLLLQHCSTVWHPACPLCLPRPFWGQAPLSHTSPHILSSGNKGTA